ncbi:MAG TPA: VOC family protein [Bacteroidales bacterium]|nr:VOC family protein [Bacteroidales bacterium]
MRLKHIALNIKKKEELTNFYQNILGFHFVYQFDLNAAYASKIFGIEKEIEVYVYSNGNITLELFVFGEETDQGFTHICFEMEDCERIAAASKKAGYSTIRIEREGKDALLFVMDKAGNKFELKNW